MRWPLGRGNFGLIARAGVLSALAVGAACSDEDVSSPAVIGGQWYDAGVAEDVVQPLDLYPAQFVVDGAGNPIPAEDAVDLTGASAGLAPNVSLTTTVGDIQVLFNEPLNADVIQDLVINTDHPVNLEDGPFNRKSQYNPGVEDIIPRQGLVEIVRVRTGDHYAVDTFYLDNIRRNVSEVTPDVGLQLYPTVVLPAGEEFQIRVYAGVIEDRDGNRVRPADRQQLVGGVGRPETIGIVTEADGRPIAAVLGFMTDAITIASVTPPEEELVDDIVTAENETAILVEFSTEVADATGALQAGTTGAFTLVDEAGVEIPVTVVAHRTGEIREEDGTPILDDDGVALEGDLEATIVEVIPAAPLAPGSYELRIDPTFADAFGNESHSVIQVEPFSVE